MEGQSSIDARLSSDVTRLDPSSISSISISSSSSSICNNADASSSKNVIPASDFSTLLKKMAAYVEGEAEVSLEDYRLLQEMNIAAAEQYSGMAEYSAGLVATAERLQARCAEVLPQLQQVRSRHLHLCSPWT